jgi:tRNA(Ile)-lysidine synthase
MFAGLPEEIRLRLLKRAIDRHGHEGPAELGKVEGLLSALDRAMSERHTRLKQTLAGAAVSLAKGRIHIHPAPPRRRRPR